MRLFETQADGTFSLAKRQYIGGNVPPYAILSHTWGADGDEVTFQDLAEGLGKEKKGCRKLEFCSKQATKDGLRFFWVDTACIDKSSSAELSEAINSMFSWYRDAARCYVYLSDVSSFGNCVAFHESKWFTRGWTLQELLAPKHVEFFSLEGDPLGSKCSRVQEIAEITGINTEAILGKRPILDFSVEERMGWTSKRDTTRAEDKVYSLLGIFDIFLPPIYGEGEKNAFRRLRKEMGDSFGQESSYRGAARDKQLGNMQRWLSPPDPSLNYHKALKQRQDGTGLWLLECEQYASWKEDAASCLWLYGIPGCGKTILSSSILQNLLYEEENPGKVFAYFYFDFNDVQKQSAELMLRSLLYQLARQSFPIPVILKTLYSSHDNGKRQLSLDGTLSAIRQLMQALPQVYILLDALDECVQRAELMDLLRTMASWELRNVHLVMTSRREREIESTLEEIVRPHNCISLQAEEVDKDIQQYVRQRLSDDKDLSKWGKDINLRQEIEIVLEKGSKGMFRWAVCQLDTLGKCRNRTMLRKALATLPSTLDQTYDRILCTISGEDSVYAMRMLQWLAFSERPLLIAEVAEAIAIDITRNPAFDREEVLEDPLDILDICSSLVTVTTERSVEESKSEESGSTKQFAVLAHYSVKEYLVSDRIQKGQAARYSIQDTACHSVITQACLGYLGQFQNFEPWSGTILQENNLALYSTNFWTSHCHKSGRHMREASQAATDFMTKDNAAYLNWLRLWNPIADIDDTSEMSVEDTWPPLYVAALFGLEGVVTLLLEAGYDVNAQDGAVYNNALQAASAEGHEQMVKTLLEAGADVNMYGGNLSTALFSASLRGYEQIVQILLEAGAHVDAQMEDRLTVLQAASLVGHSGIAKTLLEAGADVNARGGDSGTALQAASASGYEQTVKILLEAGADVNAPGDYCHNNALQLASINGNEHVAKMLLEAGADVNAQGGEYGTALHAASQVGNLQVVEALLEAGADANAQGGEYGTALHAASCLGHKQVVKMLLEAGAHVNVQVSEYGNALEAALAEDEKVVVRILPGHGADCTSDVENYRSLDAWTYFI